MDRSLIKLLRHDAERVGLPQYLHGYFYLSDIRMLPGFETLSKKEVLEIAAADSKGRFEVDCVNSGVFIRANTTQRCDMESCASTVPLRDGRARRSTKLTKPAPLKRQTSTEAAETAAPAITPAIATPSSRLSTANTENTTECKKENVNVALTFSARKSGRRVGKLEKPAPLKSSRISNNIPNSDNTEEKQDSPRTAEARVTKLLSEVKSAEGNNGCDSLRRVDRRSLLRSEASMDSGLGDLDDSSTHSRGSSEYSRLSSTASDFSRQSSTSDYSRQLSSSDYLRQISNTSQDDDWDNIDEEPVPFALETEQMKCLPYYVNQACPFNSISLDETKPDRKHRKHQNYSGRQNDLRANSCAESSGPGSVSAVEVWDSDDGSVDIVNSSNDSGNCDIGNHSNLGRVLSETNDHMQEISNSEHVVNSNCDTYRRVTLSATKCGPSHDGVAYEKLITPVTDNWESDLVELNKNQNAVSESSVNDITGSMSECYESLSNETKSTVKTVMDDFGHGDDVDKTKKSLHSMIPQPLAPLTPSPRTDSEILMFNTRSDADIDKSPGFQPSESWLKNGMKDFWNEVVVVIREPLSPTSTLNDIWTVEESLPCGLSSARGRRKMFRNYSVCMQEQPEPEEKARIEYSADELLLLGTSDLCRQVPDCWSYLVTIFPEVCLPQIPSTALNPEWYRQERQYVVEQYNVMPQRSIQPRSAGDVTKRVTFQFPSAKPTPTRSSMSDAVDIDTKCDISVRGGMKMFSTSATTSPGLKRLFSCPEPRAEMGPDFKIMDFRERQKLEATTNMLNHVSTPVDDCSDIIMKKDLPEHCPW